MSAPDVVPTRRPVLSTYRLQLRPEFTLADAVDVVEYLADLGVSHVYTSPLLQAAPGSTHGYDLTDPTRVSDELGGEKARLALVDAARARGLGLVVDIVPNHMGIDIPRANAWWWDVLLRGRSSAYASHFDIDWTQDRIVLPVLGDGPDELDRLEVITTADGPQLGYYEHRFPIAEGTESGTGREVHERQAYELVPWLSGRVGYRRFFTVNGLAALRQDEPIVFRDTHQEILRWVAAGEVDGLRVDHPDGLADPHAYLDRLAALAPDTWIVIEKILGADEDLDSRLPVAGTTGYDALREVCGLFVDPRGAAGLTALAAELTGDPGDAVALTEEGHAQQRKVALGAMRPDLERVARLMPEGIRPDGSACEEIVQALAEVMACLPVYRVDGTHATGHATGILKATVAEAVRRRPDLEHWIGIVAAALLEPSEAATRFHQSSGAVTAKGVEDRLFYRTARLIALNEVGGDPSRFGVSPAEFHMAAAERGRDWPHSMTTLSTHDTKRGEDVRARLAVLAELPDEWAASVRRWNAELPPPEPIVGYFLWQTFVGVWPLTGDAPVERLHAYAEKAAREAAISTSWSEPDAVYEQALHTWIDAVAHGPIGERIRAFAGRIAPHGWSNSLGQKLVQLTIPGVPDTYQGTEVWDDSLVDPDNRRLVDFAVRRRMLAELDGAGIPGLDASGAAKLLVTSRTLRLRRSNPGMFAGGYAPLTTRGEASGHVIGFLRARVSAHHFTGAEVAVVATRLPLGLAHAGGWRGTTVTLPSGQWTDQLTGVTHAGGPDVRVGDVLGRLPVALLVREK